MRIGKIQKNIIIISKQKINNQKQNNNSKNDKEKEEKITEKSVNPDLGSNFDIYI